VQTKLAIYSSLAFCLATSIAQASANGPQLPDGPGKATTQKLCSGCHAAEIVIGRHETRNGWEQIVGKMVANGANGTDDEFNEVIDYLVAHFAKKSEKASGEAQR
jgi:competence protein ComEA